MVTRLQNLRAVLTDDEVQFGTLMKKVLSPSEPLESPEQLRGRDEQLTEIRRALYASGRHVFIHGFRGVGKTSLAQTAAHQIQSSDAPPIVLGCSLGTTVSEIVRDVLDEALGGDPRIAKATIERGFSAGGHGLSASLAKSLEMGSVPLPTTLNEAVRMLSFFGQLHSKAPVVVVDEFDQVREIEEQRKFADFVKQVSDKHIPVRFIFCGIGESLDQLMQAHRSAHRYFHPINLGRLDYDARFEIIDRAADVLGIVVDDTTRARIARISDGFPHYVHLLAEKLFWRVFSARNGGQTNGDLFEQALQDASDAMEPELKLPYETATRKYTNDYEWILFAVADGHELQKRSSDVYDAYVRIMLSVGQKPLDREKFNARMNNLKRPAYAEILTATRQGWYEYREKVIRGYARLRAEQKGITLEIEHPLQKRRYGVAKGE